MKVYIRAKKTVSGKDVPEELRKAIELVKEINIPGTIIRVEKVKKEEKEDEEENKK